MSPYRPYKRGTPPGEEGGWEKQRKEGERKRSGGGRRENERGGRDGGKEQERRGISCISLSTSKT